MKKPKSYWNHRVFATKDIFGKIVLSIHEVYYKNDKPGGYTVGSVKVAGETVKGIKWTLRMCKACLKKPIFMSWDYPNTISKKEIKAYNRTVVDSSTQFKESLSFNQDTDNYFTYRVVAGKYLNAYDEIYLNVSRVLHNGDGEAIRLNYEEDKKEVELERLENFKSIKQIKRHIVLYMDCLKFDILTEWDFPNTISKKEIKKHNKAVLDKVLNNTKFDKKNFVSSKNNIPIEDENN